MSRVEVDPWVVCMAVRYGLARFTEAHRDALTLIREHWDVLQEWDRTIRSDLQHSLDDDLIGHRSKSGRQAIRDLIAWIEAQP